MHTGGFNMAWLRGGIGATVFAGLVLGLVPYAIRSVGNSDTPRTEGWPAVAALAMIGLGLAVCARCVWDFARTGRGTPVPFDPPRRHVRVGLYGWVRNPMYLGCLLVLLGQAALFWSRGLLAYAGAYAAAAYLFVLVYEEPTLRRKFGDAYGQYCDDVPRWLPRFRRL